MMSDLQHTVEHNIPQTPFSRTLSSSSLGPFTHLSTYHFDFDYQGHSSGHAGVSPHFSLLNQANSEFHQYPLVATLVDDFDSYVFPGVEEFETPRMPSHEDPHNFSSSFHLSKSRTNSRPSPPLQGAALSPPVMNWRAVDAAPLYLPDGAELESDKLYTGYTRYVILVFVPRQAVELVALVYGKIAHLLQQSGARVVFITAWVPSQATIFLSRFERVSPFPGPIVCDPHGALFSAFGFTQSPFRALFSASKVSAPMRQGVRNAFSTVSYRARNRDIASSLVSSKRFKCGAVVLPSLRGYAKRPGLTYCSDETSSTGVGCYLDVLKVCGVNEAFVPEIDVAQIYSRFNSMRVTSIKARTADKKERNQEKARELSLGSRKERRNLLRGIGCPIGSSVIGAQQSLGCDSTTRTPSDGRT